MKTLVSLLVILGGMSPLFAQIRIGTAGSAGINRMQRADPEPLGRRNMPLQYALEAEAWLEYFLTPSLGIRVSGTAATQQRNQLIGLEGRGRVSGFILQRSWAVGLSYVHKPAHPERLQIESWLLGGIRYNESASTGCSGFSSQATWNEQEDVIRMSVEYLQQNNTPTVPEVRAGLGISWPLFKYLTNIRMFIATEFRYSFSELASTEARFANDNYAFSENQDFSEAVEDIRGGYPLCEGNLDEIPWNFDGVYQNTLRGHLLNVRAGLMFPINWKKE